MRPLQFFVQGQPQSLLLRGGQTLDRAADTLHADSTFGRRAGLALVQPCLGAPGGRGISGTATFAKERSGETIEYHQR